MCHQIYLTSSHSREDIPFTLLTSSLSSSRPLPRADQSTNTATQELRMNHSHTFAAIPPPIPKRLTLITTRQFYRSYPPPEFNGELVKRARGPDNGARSTPTHEGNGDANDATRGSFQPLNIGYVGSCRVPGISGFWAFAPCSA